MIAKFKFQYTSTQVLEDILHILANDVYQDVEAIVTGKRLPKPTLCGILDSRLGSVDAGTNLRKWFLQHHFIHNNRWWKSSEECYWVDAFLVSKHDDSQRWYATTEENRQEALKAWGKWATGQVRGMIKALEGVIASRKK